MNQTSKNTVATTNSSRTTVTVHARAEIVEDGFKGPGRYVHARAGEAGTIVEAVGDGWYMVRWHRTGTAAQCDASELALA
jgi:hypothetical protein